MPLAVIFPVFLPVSLVGLRAKAKNVQSPLFFPGLFIVMLGSNWNTERLNGFAVK